ncbi:MAG: imidazole glycerol phosphate synthase subunit HisH [Candidatus Omnitrophota bacterium]
MVAIVDYGMGNLANVKRACLSFGLEAEIVSGPERLARADKIMLPGVGAFGRAMRRLNSSGLSQIITRRIMQGVSFLGICLGMHLLFEHSQESPGVKGLGVLKGGVVRLNEKQAKVPHMGWNNVRKTGSIRQKRENILKGVKDGEYFYFCHSYYVAPKDKAIISMVCDYGTTIPAIVIKKNIIGIQFHPEKSQDSGLRVLANFLDYCCPKTKNNP